MASDHKRFFELKFFILSDEKITSAQHRMHLKNNRIIKKSGLPLFLNERHRAEKSRMAMNYNTVVYCKILNQIIKNFWYNTSEYENYQ